MARCILNAELAMKLCRRPCILAISGGRLMPGKIYRDLAGDHRRLDALLERAMSDPENIDAAAYAQFRSGLLKHIGVKEKVLLPAAQKLRGGEPLPVAPECASITARCAAGPIADGAGGCGDRAILKDHNPIEEDLGGMYDHCEQLAEAERGSDIGVAVR